MRTQTKYELLTVWRDVVLSTPGVELQVLESRNGKQRAIPTDRVVALVQRDLDKIVSANEKELTTAACPFRSDSALR